jgi:gamma-glutamyltranspeptidase/glutathione hydrolase
MIAHPARAVLLAGTIALPGCATMRDITGIGRVPEGTPGFVRGFIGAAVADEPRAVLAARQVLASGGNAADAAVALGFALAVTLPSRAGLGSGGACLALKGDPEANGVPEAILFLPPASPSGSPGADRPAAAPMLARGLFLLHSRHGKARFETLIQPAETMAREGTAVSRAFLHDLQVVGPALASDQPAQRAFFPAGRPPAEGEILAQPDLAATLAQLRRAGVGDLYVGPLAQRLAQASAANGTGITTADLRAALPREADPLLINLDQQTDAVFLPAPADGGPAAAASFQALRANPGDLAGARAAGLAAAAAFRRAPLGPLPASTSFATLDPAGNAVVCDVSMGNLFGTGRVAAGTGILLAASPAWMPPPLYAAGMLVNRRNSAVRVAAGGSGQEGAALAVAKTMVDGLGDRGRAATINPAAVPDPGRANVIACTGIAANDPQTCGWATDPRGFGFATGSN